MTSLIGALSATHLGFGAVPSSSIGSAALQRASCFLGSLTYLRGAELGMPTFITSNPVNHGGLCASFVSSVLSQVGFPDLSLSVQPALAFPDVLRGALLAKGFVPMPLLPSLPPGAVILWPNNEHAAFFVRSDANTMLVLNSNTDHRAVAQTVRFDTHLMALEQRAIALRPPF